MLDGVPHLMGGHSEGRHGVRVVNGLAQSQGFCARIVMVAQFSRHAFHSNVTYAVVAENTSCDFSAGHPRTGRVLAVGSKPALGDCGSPEA